MRYYFTIILVCLLGLLPVSAQNVMFYGSKQGLSNSLIKSIHEDSRHNIWITTRNGLNRYDGIKMNVYRHIEGDSTSLNNDETTFVFQYDKDRIIVGTGIGLQVFNFATDKFQELPIIGLSGRRLQTKIISINRVYADRIICCVANFGSCEIVEREDGCLEAKIITEFNTDKNGVNPISLLYDKDRLWIVNSARDVFLKVKNGEAKRVEGVRGVLRLQKSASGEIYAATLSDGIFKYNVTTARFEMVASAVQIGGVVCSFSAWRDGLYFVCTDGGGLRIFDEKTKAISLSTMKMNDFNLATANVKDAICDAFGNVWVGIYWKGVMVKPANQSAFEYIGSNSITRNTIGSNSVLAVVGAGNGTLWVATDNDGLYNVSADGTSSEHWNKSTNPGMPNVFTSICPVTDTQLLLGTFFDGLWQMKDGSFRMLTDEIKQIFEIRPAGDGAYWIATVGNGFYYYNLSANTFTQYTATWNQDGEGSKIIGNPYLYTILPVGDRLYLGGVSGLRICKVENGGVIREESMKLLNDVNVRHLVLAPDGKTVWAATEIGLVSIDTKSFKTKRYTVSDGLSINSTVSLCFVGDNLWVGTDKGLSCMNVKTEKFSNFFVEDGLQDNEFCRGSVFVRNGRVYIGGISGLTYFDDKNIAQRSKEEHRLSLRLVDLMMGNKTIHVGDKSGSYDILHGVLDDVPEIELGYSDNRFSLVLGVDGLVNQHVTYQYSINGSGWVEQGGSTSHLVFDNLEPGEYQVKVRALAFGGVSEEREIMIVIHPAWYATVWAKVIYIIIFLLICWLGIQYARRQMKARRVIERRRHERDLEEARIQFVMDINHDIRTPMTLIMSPVQQLIGHDSDPERQRNYKLILQNTERILSIIDRLREVKHMSQPTKYVKPANVVEEEVADTFVDKKTTDSPHRNVVLVEDDDAVRQYVRSELSGEFVIHEFSNGQEAWDYVISHTNKADLIVCDVMMPVMDGMTLCQKVKANFNTNHIPLILITALGSDSERIASMTNGADAYISKPFNMDVLRSTMLNLLRTRQVLQGKYTSDRHQEESIDKIEMESPDEHLMNRVMKVINENLSNSEVSVEDIADKVGISRVHFYRKMKELTGQAPREFIKYVRLKEAARLLSEKHLDVTTVSYTVGFKSQTSFSTSFKALYGLTPTEWMKKSSEEQKQMSVD